MGLGIALFRIHEYTSLPIMIVATLIALSILQIITEVA